MQILLATRNPGKLREWQSILSGVPVQLQTLAGWPQLPEAEESGSTFLENARIKAIHFRELTGLPTVGEDSGLEVDALGRRPGVHSARYADSDAARIQRVLTELSGLPHDRRSARFVCALHLALPDGRELGVEGEVRGAIAMEPRGSGGFGYDPIFWYPPLKRTFAELTLEEKNRISHRADAVRRFLSRLPEIL